MFIDKQRMNFGRLKERGRAREREREREGKRERSFLGTVQGPPITFMRGFPESRGGDTHRTSTAGKKNASLVARLISRTDASVTSAPRHRRKMWSLVAHIVEWVLDSK